MRIEENIATIPRLKSYGNIGRSVWNPTGGIIIGNTHSAKANRAVRKFLDRYFRDLPNDKEVTADCICSIVNEADHRRTYSSGRIGALLREREDIEQTSNGWKKKSAEATA